MIPPVSYVVDLPRTDFAQHGPGRQSVVGRETEEGRAPDAPSPVVAKHVDAGHESANLQQPGPQDSGPKAEHEREQSGKDDKSQQRGDNRGNPQGGELSATEQQEVERLIRRDAEVRRHEQAHAAAGGALTGSPNYKYKRGPDGRRYAVGGDVSVDTSPVRGDPEATIRKLTQVKRAALAPANPSGQDRRVAARAEMRISEARQQLAEEQRLERAANREAQGIATEPGRDDSDSARERGPADRPSARPGPIYSRTQLVSQRLATRSYEALQDSLQQPASGLDVIACAKCGGSHG